MTPGLLILLAVLLSPAVWASGRKPDPGPSSPAEPSAPATSAPPPIEQVPETQPENGQSAPPVYLLELPNPNDFGLFANGGWDGNWYVGYNTCWISKLPPAPKAEYSRAFIGAKLGRMKTEPIPGRPSWERRPIAGEVNIAVAQEPLWPQSRRFLLAESADIPLEPDAENAVEGVGEGRWFWVEVPVRFVSLEKENYVALFSPSESFTDSRHAPILAAGWGESRDNTWLNSSAKGEPPFHASEALKTSVTYFEPAIAIKLVPPNGHKVDVTLIDPPAKEVTLTEKLVLSATVEGTNLESAWVEFSTDTRAWKHATGTVWGGPYIFSVKSTNLPEGRNFLRVAAKDQWENKGVSAIVTVRVPPAEPAKKKRSR